MRCRFLLPGTCGPRHRLQAYGLKVSIFRTAYAARAIGALLSFATSFDEPITVVSHRNKANPFRRSSILFRPHGCQMSSFGGDAGYRPLVRSAYYERVYVHSPEGQDTDRCSCGVVQVGECRWVGYLMRSHLSAFDTFVLVLPTSGWSSF